MIKLGINDPYLSEEKGFSWMPYPHCIGCSWIKKELLNCKAGLKFWRDCTRNERI